MSVNDSCRVVEVVARYKEADLVEVRESFGDGAEVWIGLA